MCWISVVQMWLGGQILLVGKKNAFRGEVKAANNELLTPETSSFIEKKIELIIGKLGYCKARFLLSHINIK